MAGGNCGLYHEPKEINDIKCKDVYMNTCAEHSCPYKHTEQEIARFTQTEEADEQNNLNASDKPDDK